MWLKRIIKYFIILVVLFLVVIGLFIGAVYVGIFGPLPGKRELIGINNEEASLVFSNDGTLIGKFFAENRTNIKWRDVPPHLTKALIATEDKRFFEHGGIDGRSYLRVFFKSILLGDKSSGGGSTITQQLVKNLYGRDNRSFLSMPVSKTREAIIASRMEDVLSKQEIILLYLNSVPFGEEVYGVEAASKRYFDKNAKNLNIQEAAVLVGILKANTYYNPRLNPEHAIKRRNQVIGLMANEGFLTIAEADSIKKLKLGLKYVNYRLESPAGYFVYQVKKRAAEILEDYKNAEGEAYDIRKDGLKIFTTLDIRVQQLANTSAKKQLAKMQPLLDKELARTGQRKKWETTLKKSTSVGKDWKENRNREILKLDGMKAENISKADSLWHYYKMLNAAVLAANPKTGAVLAWTGGNNFRYLPYDLVLAERQIASTIKPFIYAAALEEGFEICDYFENSVKEYKDYEGWKPENYDKSSSDKMKVAMWYALTRSMNLPTVDIYFETGHDEVADVLRRLDLNAPFEETPALALGALDASLYDLVKAYSAFANEGLLNDELVMIEKITDADGHIIYKNEEVEKTRVFTNEVAGQITAMLEIAIDEGTGVRMRNRYGIKADLAGKTGTAQNYSDARFMVYTPNIVLGIWVGARSPEMHFRSGLGSGSVLALPIAGEIISSVEKQTVLRNKYLSAFSFEAGKLDTIDCEPFREKGLSGVFNRMKKPSPDKVDFDTVQRIEEKPEKERSKIGKFFDNLFNRKDKKDKKKKKKKKN
jgi:penicillin-binding protein 1A